MQLIFGSFLIIFISIFFGFKVLTKMFLFITQLNSSGRPVEKSDYIPPSPPVFISRFEATNSAYLVLKGIAEPGSMVFLTQNSNSVKSVVASENGEFEFSQVILTDGDNEFFGVAVDPAGNKSQPSNKLNIYLSIKEPKLVIEKPITGQVFSGNNSKIEISGLTDPEVRLTINERVVIVATDGRFHHQLGLSPGENKLLISAVNKAGNRIQKEITVSYQP
jgi:hypothetical protein